MGIKRKGVKDVKKKFRVFLIINLIILATYFVYGGQKDNSSVAGVSETFYKERFVSESTIVVFGGLVPWETIDSKKESNLVPWEIKEKKKLVPLEEVMVDYIELESEFVSLAYDVNANVNEKHFELRNFWRMGEHRDLSGYRFTYYSEKILPGRGLNIPGRHLNSEGYVCDELEYICLASIDLPKGTVVRIPFGDGMGKVYDECDVSGTLDVYVK